MPADENVLLVQRQFETFGRGDVEVALDAVYGDVDWQAPVSAHAGALPWAPVGRARRHRPSTPLPGMAHSGHASDQQRPRRHWPSPEPRQITRENINRPASARYLPRPPASGKTSAS